jgi:RHS repeat-associated protein
MGTGAAFTAAITVNSPVGLELSREQSVCGAPAVANEVSATPTGLYDIDGDGQPEIIANADVTTGAHFWNVYQLRPPAGQIDTGNVASVPAAGRLTKIDNGYGAITRIGYKSAKEDTVGAHNLPYPEIVVAAVATTDSGGTLLQSTTRYAYGGAELSFDSLADGFVFPGYKRSLQLVGTDPSTPNESVATLTDTYPLEPFSTEQHTNADSRYKRYRRVGKVSDVTTLSGDIGTDPWALLTTNIANDARRISGMHYTYDSRLLSLGRRISGNEECVDVMFPYDFSKSKENSLHDDQCTQIGFAFVQEVTSWQGRPGTSDAFTSATTLKTQSLVRQVDSFGRATEVALLEDLATNQDDVCVRTVYAAPNGTNERVLSAVASTTTVSGNCVAAGEITLSSTSFEYDTSAAGAKLPAGKVAAGFVTSQTVSRRRTDNGSPINDAAGKSDVRLFDATYDAAGNPRIVQTTRDDGATRTATTGYDEFGLVAVSKKLDATNANGTAIPTLLTTIVRDPITLSVTRTTDPNGTERGNTFDGFGRVLLSTAKAFGDPNPIRARAATRYLGFGVGQTGGRRIERKAFRDFIPQELVGTTVGRRSTTFFDSLGRMLRTEIELGSDYANKIVVAGRRTYDMLGRVLFQADSFPSDQSFSTAYGTTYYFNTDGTPKCFIRGRGQQAFVTEINESIERYPTCMGRNFAGNREIDQVTDTANASVTHFSTYDAIGRLVNRSTAVSSVDVNTGDVSTVRNEAADFSYDRLGQPNRMVRYGNAESFTLPVAMTWNYDSLGQVLELHEPDSAVQFRSYDNWGAMTQVQWNDTTTASPTDRRTIVAYDALGRTVHTEDRTNNVVDADTVNDYLYDQPVNFTTPVVISDNVLGRLSQARSPTGTVAIGYDGFGRVDTNVFTDSTVNPAKVYVSTQTYLDDGSLDIHSLRLPDTDFLKRETVKYTYDSAGRTRTATYRDGTITQNIFSATGPTDIDVFGRILQAQYGATAFTADFSGTGRRLMNSVKVTAPSGTSREIAYTSIPGLSTTFDPLGRERGRREVFNGDVSAASTFSFSYSLLSQLASIARTPASTALPNMSFAYDALGNINSLTAATGTSGATLTYQTTDRDRICSIAYGSGTPNSTCNVKYDGVGNIVEQPSRDNGLRKFTYFANGQVKRVTDEGGNDANFRYDAFGDLQQLDLTSNISPDTRRDRHFGGWITQREEVVAAVKKTVITRLIAGPGVTATRHGAEDTAPWTFAFGETRGNRFFTNQAGEFVQDVDYQAYGESKSSGAQPGSPAYSSEQWNGGDALTALGLSQLGARLYDPLIGRFLSRDPLIIPRTAATTNPYAFADNDPINSSDPTGLVVNEPGPGKDCGALCGGIPPTSPAPGGGGGGGGGGIPGSAIGGAIGGGAGGGTDDDSGSHGPGDFGPDFDLGDLESPGGRDGGELPGGGGGGGGGSGGGTGGPKPTVTPGKYHAPNSNGGDNVLGQYPASSAGAGNYGGYGASSPYPVAPGVSAANTTAEDRLRVARVLYVLAGLPLRILSCLKSSGCDITTPLDHILDEPENPYPENPTVQNVQAWADRGAKILADNPRIPELPRLDATGKVHGDLPRAKELRGLSDDELRGLRDELRQSVTERIRVTKILGSDPAHGERQSREQALIRQIDKALGE